MDTEQAKKTIRDTFENSFDKKQFTIFIKNLLNKVEEATLSYEESYISEAFRPYIKSLECIANYTDGTNTLDVLVVTLQKDTSLDRARTMQRNFVAGYLQGKYGSTSLKDAALVAFVPHNHDNWRFSLVKTDYRFEKTSNGNVKVKEEFTPAKRWSFLVGKNEKSHTAQKQFLPLLENESSPPKLKDLEEAFNIEVVTKEFYKEIANWYFWALKESRFTKDAESETNGRNIALIRFITRIIFIWFMKQKGIIRKELFDREFLQSILTDLSDKEGTYYKAILQNLFFATLNTPIEQRKFRREERFNGYLNKDYMNHNYFRYHNLFKDPNKMQELFNDIPFLNGGLFECLDKRKNDESNDARKEIRIDGFSDDPQKQPYLPNFLFFSDEKEVDLNEDYGTKNQKYTVKGFINILNLYNFTVDENTPVDIDVALNPELLGRVFENLLASYNPETATTARKATGSYYTPREIVDYMVKESIKAYLKEKVPGIDKKNLDQLFLYDDDKNPFDEESTKKIINAIHNLKIIDPAVGSGAFPMGALHNLVHILHKLDPHNEQWKAEQIKVVQHIPDPQLKQNIFDKIEESFTLNELDYGRKLYLIQNCIYGVDIQPIAIQIAKLRFFISLLVDERIDKSKPNLGIEPLPNLETKLVSANTLIKFDVNKDNELKPQEAEELEQELKEVRNQYFIATSTKEKEKLKKKDRELRKALAEILAHYGWRTEKQEKLARWDPYNINKSAEWFDPEWMFGIRDGFDIVIGNPPYIQLQKNHGQLADLYKDKGFETFDRMGDIYCLFYEKGLQILRAGGYICFITSNKWMRAGYGEKIRSLFLKHNPVILIDLGPGIFESATVDTNILLVQKTQNLHQLKAVTIQRQNNETVDIEAQLNTRGVQLTNLTKDAWFIGSSAEQKLKEKIESIGKPLKEWDVKIYRGVLTGLNEAFIITTEKRNEILANCKDDASTGSASDISTGSASERKRTEAIIKPILRGRDIKRYYYEWAGLWVIFIPWHFPLHEDLSIQGASKKAEEEFQKQYSSVYAHLLQYKDALSKRNKEETGIRYEWYALQRCAATYYPEFEKEKVVYSEIVRKPQFHFDTENFYVEATSFLMTGKNVKYICGLLNSKPITYFFKKWYAGGGLGEEGYRYKKAFLENLPLPPITPANQSIVKQIEELVDKILAAHASTGSATPASTGSATPASTGSATDAEFIEASVFHANTSKWEREIDRLVYKLYDLTEEEIRIVEGKSAAE